jgi:regulator of protease activity HflC (stomatin/prohibitin superfamily)
MNQLIEYFSQFLQKWKFWIVVSPWDIGVRVRIGKLAASLKPGPHLRIPLLDEIVLVNTRQRVCATACVTLQGLRPGFSIVKSATIGYRIVDPASAMMRYSNMDSTIICLVQAELAARRSTSDIETALRISMRQYGVDVDFVRLVEDVEVKTFRMLNDTWRPSTAHGDAMPIGVSSTSRF